MPYPNEHACRLMDPSSPHDEVRRSSKPFGDKQADVIWYKSGGKMQMQAVRFPKDSWSAGEASAMCKKMGGSFEAASGSEKSLTDEAGEAFAKAFPADRKE